MRAALSGRDSVPGRLKKKGREGGKVNTLAADPAVASQHHPATLFAERRDPLFVDEDASTGELVVFVDHDVPARLIEQAQRYGVLHREGGKGGAVMKAGSNKWGLREWFKGPIRPRPPRRSRRYA